MPGPVVLTADDDPNALRAFECDLKKQYCDRYRVLWADSGDGALNIVRRPDLIDNAVNARGQLVLRTAAEFGGAVVETCDDGLGTPRELRERIFEPFLTTKAMGAGTGLDTVRRIVQSHRGWVHVGSEPGRTSFHVRLPFAGSKAVQAGGNRDEYFRRFVPFHAG